MKTKKSSVNKQLTTLFDRPSVKTTDGIFLVPQLEVYIWPSNKDILNMWEADNPEITIAGDLWGFCDAYSFLHTNKGGPVRIHTRSVRSHGNKEEFYHTLGHELAHILEYMERRPSGTMQQARWDRLFYEIKCTFYQTKAWFLYQFGRIWKRLWVGGEDTKTHKEHK